MENVYNSILLNSVLETYHIVVNILELQEQFTPLIIINQLLEESRKMGGVTTESSGKMKMALLSNTKPGKGRKSVGKKGGFKDGKKDLHYDFCNNDGHEKENCWMKHPELRPKKRKKGRKQRNIKFAMSVTIKSVPVTQSSKTNDDTE